MRSTIVILILLAIGALFLFATNRGDSLVDLGEGVIVNQDGTIKGNYSIEDIQGIGTPYECSFQKISDVAQVSGIIRMVENKVRGDFDININPKSTSFGDSDTETRAFFASHFITKENITYTWTSLQNIGYKSPVVESAERNASVQEQAQIVGLNDKVAYECKPWNAILNDFDLPSGINFVKLE